MKKVLLFLFFLLLFWIVSAPKAMLFFMAEEMLHRYEMQVVARDMHKGLLTAKLKGVTLYKSEQPRIEAERATFLPLLFYNRLDLEGVRLHRGGKDSKGSAPGRCTLTHSLLHPARVALSCSGEAGRVEGTVEFGEGSMRLRWDPSRSSAAAALRRYFHKTEEGYRYEYRF